MGQKRLKALELRFNLAPGFIRERRAEDIGHALAGHRRRSDELSCARRHKRRSGSTIAHQAAPGREGDTAPGAAARRRLGDRVRDPVSRRQQDGISLVHVRDVTLPARCPSSAATATPKRRHPRPRLRRNDAEHAP